jgi:AcrR family transcriptional regulator
MDALKTTAAPAAEDLQTRDRIMHIAEKLFADHGYNGVSLRSIMAEAGVNMAAVHYYFRSKEGLLKAVIESRVKPMNAERTVLLDACEREAVNGRPDLRQVLAAFVGPAMSITRDPGGEAFGRLAALCSVDPSPEVRTVSWSAYDEIARRFVEILRRACPHLSPEEFFWRLNCFYGSMMYVRANNGRVARLVSETAAGSTDTLQREQLLDFVEAGFRTPSSTAKA